MLFPWQQRIQSSSTVERSSRTSPFWKLRCPSAVPVWSHSARTALQHKRHRRLSALGTPRGSHRTGGSRDLLLRQRCPPGRDLYKEPPARAVPGSWSRAGMAQRVWGHRGQPRGGRGGGKHQTPFGMDTCPPCPLGQSHSQVTAAWIQKTHNKMLKIVPQTPGKNS